MSETVEVSLESVLARENLATAWKAVKRNDGGPGVDRKTIRETQVHLKEHWGRIQEKLLSGTYQPAAVRVAEIAKPNGGIRRLGIPTVQDRVIQQALHQVLSAAFDSAMSEHSYGFRPNRSAHDAVQAARGYVKQGKHWVVDIDLKNFFDQVNHDRLMQGLRARIADKRVLGLIARYLRAPMREADGREQRRERGVPQGAPVSPVLSNLYLDPLDRELERRGIAFVRYADDIAVFVSSERAAQRVLESVTAWLSRHLDVEVNIEKSGTGRSEDGALLGFRIHANGDVSPAPKAMERLKGRVRELWDARQSVRLVELRANWRRYIEGWWGYFGYANNRRPVTSLSGWIRRHMRKYFWLRWHDWRGRRNALVRLGIRGKALGVASTRRGAWRMARHHVMQTALRNRTLEGAGFILPWLLAG
jgi:RNA-directed DNA polymerase